MVQRLIHCSEHDDYLIRCRHLHNNQPLKSTAIAGFNDGNNLTVATIEVKLYKGKTYYQNRAGKWIELDVEVAEERGMIEPEK